MLLGHWSLRPFVDVGFPFLFGEYLGMKLLGCVLSVWLTLFYFYFEVWFARNALLVSSVRHSDSTILSIMRCLVWHFSSL